MTTAFMWRLTDGDRIVYHVLHHRILAEVLIASTRSRSAAVVAYDNSQDAQHGALVAVEAWEQRGYLLHAVYAHSEPNQMITSGLLVARSRHVAGKHEDCEKIIADVVREFYDHGKAL